MQSPVHVKLCHKIFLNEISPLKKYTYFSLKRNELIDRLHSLLWISYTLHFIRIYSCPLNKVFDENLVKKVCYYQHIYCGFLLIVLISVLSQMYWVKINSHWLKLSPVQIVVWLFHTELIFIMDHISSGLLVLLFYQFFQQWVYNTVGGSNVIHAIYQ